MRPIRAARPIAELAPQASDSYLERVPNLVRVYVPRALFISRVTPWLELLDEMHRALRNEKTLRRMTLEVFEVPQDRLSVQYKGYQLNLKSGGPVSERIVRVVRRLQEREAEAFYRLSASEQIERRREYAALMKTFE